MSDEHGWPDFADDPGHHDQHDAGDHHDAGVHAEPDEQHVWHDEAFDSGPGAEPHAEEPYEPPWQHHPDPDPGPGSGPEPESGAEPAHPVVDVTDGHAMGPVGADPDAADVAHDGGDPAAVFPPALDVGALPEPVDGFPWIDTGSLGVVDPLTVPAEPVAAADLAGYAAEELPPAVDPWAHLAQSQDPATSALARWWSENG